MNKESKKEIFKFLIKEFHTEKLPEVYNRELEITLSSKKIITVYGVRRCGKSFYFYSLIKRLLQQGTEKKRILYLNFEDDRILPLHFKELNSLIEAYFELYPENKSKEVYLFFDEIQNIYQWEVFVRRIYDKEKAKIFITGSSSKLLSKEIATSLRGRTISFSLTPLNFREFLKFKGIELEKDFQYSSKRFKVKKLLLEYLEWGGLPEVVLEKSTILKKKILEEYFKFLVYRDLIDRFSLENTFLLKDLLKYLFTNITGLFSVNNYYRSIKQGVPVSRETVSSYLDRIQETGYFSLLPKFSYSLKNQRVNPKKLIALDNGLRNKVAFKFSKDKGKLAENLVGSYFSSFYQQEELYYWQNKQEVDFVLKEDSGLSAINVCMSSEVPRREVSSLIELKDKFKKVKDFFIITEDLEQQEMVKGVKIKFIPLWKWLIQSKI